MRTYLVATDLGYLSVRAKRELDAIRWLRLHFGYKLKISSLMDLGPEEDAS